MRPPTAPIPPGACYMWSPYGDHFTGLFTLGARRGALFQRTGRLPACIYFAASGAGSAPFWGLWLQERPACWRLSSWLELPAVPPLGLYRGPHGAAVAVLVPVTASGWDHGHFEVTEAGLALSSLGIEQLIPPAFKLAFAPRAPSRGLAAAPMAAPSTGTPRSVGERRDSPPAVLALPPVADAPELPPTAPAFDRQLPSRTRPPRRIWAKSLSLSLNGRSLDIVSSSGSLSPYQDRILSRP